MTQIIFIHIPKTAGTSIISLLNKHNISYKSGHHTAIELKQQISKQEWENAIKFSVVRNPWDRICSIYHYYKQNNATNITPNMLRNDFIAFVHNLCGNNPDAWLLDTFISPLKYLQKSWVYDKDQLIINYIIRFEDLNNGILEVFDKLKIQMSNLPHNGRSKHKFYTTYYDDTTEELVYHKFIEDITTFNYSFMA